MTALSPKLDSYEKVPDYLYAPGSRWTAAIAGVLRFLSDPGGKARFAFWPTALAAIVVLKAGFSLTLKPDSFLTPYVGLPYFSSAAISHRFRHPKRNREYIEEPAVLGAPGNGLRALDVAPMDLPVPRALPSH